MEIIKEQYIKNIYKVSMVLLFVLCLYFGVRVLSEFRSYNMMDRGISSITVTGHAEVKATPDIANIYFNINSTSKTVKDAQAKVAEIEKKAIDVLKTNKVDEKDIKTENASFNPKYDYVRSICPQSTGMMTVYDCGGKQVLVGYEATESITVKVRNVDDVSKIMQELGSTGVSNLSGPNFAIDDEDILKAQAKKEAIDDAKEKAIVLAKELGVRLGKPTGFSESAYYPMYDSKAYISAAAVSAPTRAELPRGQNTVSSDVNITYEIR